MSASEFHEAVAEFLAREAQQGARVPAQVRTIDGEPLTESAQAEPIAHATGPEPVCEQAPYPRYEPGTYEAECVSAQIYHDRQFHSWKCVLRFSILGDGAPVFCFLHLGSKEKPFAGPRSEYRRAWVIANGEQPRKRQTMSARVFVGKIFEVRIDEVVKDRRQREHPKAAIYSLVREIIRRTYP